MANANETALLLTTTQVARQLKCSGEHVRQLIAAGELRAKLVGDDRGWWVVDAESVAAYERDGQQ